MIGRTGNASVFILNHFIVRKRTRIVRLGESVSDFNAFNCLNPHKSRSECGIETTV